MDVSAPSAEQAARARRTSHHPAQGLCSSGHAISSPSCRGNAEAAPRQKRCKKQNSPFPSVPYCICLSRSWATIPSFPAWDSAPRKTSSSGKGKHTGYAPGIPPCSKSCAGEEAASAAPGAPARALLQGYVQSGIAEHQQKHRGHQSWTQSLFFFPCRVHFPRKVQW